MGKLQGIMKTLLRKKRLLLLVILMGVCSFSGGMMVANAVGNGIAGGVAKVGVFPSLFANKPISDWEWATSRGLISGNVEANQQVTQAEFLKMLITVYQPEQQGVIVPHGVENHWAAPFYATAKNEGLIDCSCQIKPDERITYQEASKFIYRTMNRKLGKDQVKLEEVQAWGKHRGDVTISVTYSEAASLLHKMDGMVEKGRRKEGGE